MAQMLSFGGERHRHYSNLVDIVKIKAFCEPWGPTGCADLRGYISRPADYAVEPQI